MLFNSMQYLIFLPLVTLIYYIIPKKIRYIWLLVVSYFFYMSWNSKYAILIATSTLITYLCGLGIHYIRKKYPRNLEEKRGNTWCKLVVAGAFISNLGILIFFKYFDWIINNINSLLHMEITSPFSLVLPVGISFYTFQALSYTIDVYRGDIKAEKNLARYALFVSFFPQLVAGPIERSKNLLHQLVAVDRKAINFKEIRSGLCLIMYGFFLKIVIADRVAILVDTVFDNYNDYGFCELVLGAVLFAVQILCDFNGYTTIAKGSAQLLGIRLMDNFKQPYLATSIKDFWRRWHISLTSWFTDYMYIPLGGSRKGTLRQMLNVIIVFFASGLWHGASWHYVVWGLLHGGFQDIGIAIRSLMKKLGIKEKKKISFGKRIWKTLLIFICTDIAWVFFRATTCKDAVLYFVQMGSSVKNASLLDIGFQWYDWAIIIGAVLTMFIVDVLHEKGIKIREGIFKRNAIIRWCIYLCAFWIVLMLGIYGVDYDAGQFIYFQF